MSEKPFATGFWGELNLPSKKEEVPPKEEEKKKPEVVDEDDEEKDKPDKEEDQDYSDKLDESKESEKTPDDKESDDAKSDDDEGEDITFTETDAEKAFLMLDEEGVLEIDEDAEFTPDPKGLADAVAATVRKKLQEEISKTPEAVQQLYAHLASGNDVSSFTFKQTTDWESIDLDNEANQEAALRAQLQSQGFEPDEIEEEVKDTKEAGKLELKAKRAAGVLAKNQKANEAAEAKRRAQEAKDAEKKAKAEQKEMEEKLESLEEVAGFKLDNAGMKKGLRDHIYKVDPRTGLSQLQKNLQDKDRILKIAFLDYIEYNKADIEKKVTSKITKTRLKKARKFSDTNLKNKPGASVKSSDTKNTGKLKFPTLFGGNVEIED